MMICRKLETELKKMLPDLLLDPERVPAEVRAHVEQCADCRRELAALEATMTVLDGWEGVEPSPFFDARMAARMREERSAPPAGWLARMRARLEMGSNRHLRPLVVGALALALMIGGGTYAGLEGFNSTAKITPAAASAMVRDLQSLDENSQLFQQMDMLDQPDNGASAGSR
jgi:anti-sigma factor RsiW